MGTPAAWAVARQIQTNGRADDRTTSVACIDIDGGQSIGGVSHTARLKPGERACKAMPTKP